MRTQLRLLVARPRRRAGEDRATMRLPPRQPGKAADVLETAAPQDRVDQKRMSPSGVPRPARDREVEASEDELRPVRVRVRIDPDLRRGAHSLRAESLRSRGRTRSWTSWRPRVASTTRPRVGGRLHEPGAVACISSAAAAERSCSVATETPAASGSQRGRPVDGLGNAPCWSTRFTVSASGSPAATPSQSSPRPPVPGRSPPGEAGCIVNLRDPRVHRVGPRRNRAEKSSL